MVRPTEKQEQIAGELLKWILNYVAPVFFVTGRPPQGNLVINATVSFVNCGKFIAVINNHVLEAFENLKESNPHAQLQFSHLIIPVEDRLICRNKKLDLATFQITDKELRIIQKQAISPSKWPPDRPIVDDIILFSGYPNIYSRKVNSRGCLFEAVPILELIKSVSEKYITVWFDRNNWKKYLGYRELSELTSLGGFSGAATFIPSKSQIMRPELVGFLSECAPNLDIVLIRHADFITSEGIIKDTC